jgi:hypothetical protein
MTNRNYVEILEKADKINRYSWAEGRSKDHLLPGDLLLFNRDPDDKVSGLLARFLARIDKFWDGWGWHMAYVHDVLPDESIIVAEAKIGRGVQLTKYADRDSLGDIRAYRWIDGLIPTELESYTQKHIGCAYDMACYFWTGLQLVIRKLLGLSIPRINNNKYTCWELVCDMTHYMGKPLQPVRIYPVITEMVRVLENERIHRG